MYAHTFCLKTLFQAKEISNLIYKYVAMYSSAKQEGQGLAGVLRNNQEAQRMWTPSNSVPLWSSLSQLVMWLQKKTDCHKSCTIVVSRIWVRLVYFCNWTLDICVFVIQVMSTRTDRGLLSTCIIKWSQFL